MEYKDWIVDTLKSHSHFKLPTQIENSLRRSLFSFFRSISLLCFYSVDFTLCSLHILFLSLAFCIFEATPPPLSLSCYLFLSLSCLLPVGLLLQIWSLRRFLPLEMKERSHLSISFVAIKKRRKKASQNCKWRRNTSNLWAAKLM